MNSYYNFNSIFKSCDEQKLDYDPENSNSKARFNLDKLIKSNCSNTHRNLYNQDEEMVKKLSFYNPLESNMYFDFKSGIPKTEEIEKAGISTGQSHIYSKKHDIRNKNLFQFSSKFLPELEKSESVQAVINSSFRKKDIRRTLLDRSLINLQQGLLNHKDNMSVKLLRLNNLKHEHDLEELKMKIESQLKCLELRKKNIEKEQKVVNNELVDLNLQIKVIQDIPIDQISVKTINSISFSTPLIMSPKALKFSKRVSKSEISTDQFFENQQRKQKSSLKKKEEIQKSKEKFKLFEFKRDSLRMEHQKVEIERRNLKEELEAIKFDLLHHYHQLLNEGKDARNEGLSWIIKAIYNLGYDVIPTYLPKFLDKDFISYIFKKAHLEIELEEMNYEIQIAKFFIKTNQTIISDDNKDYKKVLISNKDKLKMYFRHNAPELINKFDKEVVETAEATTTTSEKASINLSEFESRELCNRSLRKKTTFLTKDELKIILRRKMSLNKYPELHTKFEEINNKLKDEKVLFTVSTNLTV